MDNQRNAYRTMKDVARISIWAAWPGHEYQQAEIINLSANGAAIMLPEKFLTVAGFSDHPYILLRIKIPDFPDLDQIKATILNTCGAKGYVTFSIEFEDWHKLHDNLPQSAFSVFNRRAFPRVMLPSEFKTQVTVTNSTTKKILQADLINISEAGLLLMFAGNEHPNEEDRLKLTFMLPDTDFSYDVMGRVANVRSLAQVNYCGIEFIAFSEQFKAQQKKITRYISSRLAELVAEV